MSGHAVLLVAHNRSVNLEKLIRQIQQMEIRLYVSIDGPRRESDIRENELCKEIVLKCQSQIYRFEIFESNQGLRKHVSDAISWAFETEEILVIIEEDLQLDNSAILYLSSSIKDFEELEMVGVSCGTRIIEDLAMTDEISYVRTFSPWGWSLSKTRWLDFQLYLLDGHALDLYWLTINLVRSRRPIHWAKTIRYARLQRLDSWATIFQEYLFARNLLAAVPPTNLVVNVGWNNGATHTLGPVPSWVPQKFSPISSYRVSSPQAKKIAAMDAADRRIREKVSSTK